LNNLSNPKPDQTSWFQRQYILPNRMPILNFGLNN
jgi:hypothetical protein